MDPINPSVIALHGALVELTLRVGRLEQKMMLHEPIALATFAQPGSDIPAPYEPCSCEEALSLQAHIQALSSRLGVTP
jgi:hypothetical protein